MKMVPKVLMELGPGEPHLFWDSHGVLIVCRCMHIYNIYIYMVGGFSPTHLKNMIVKMGIFPRYGVKMKNI